MDWTNILMLIFGSGGAIAGVSSWIKTRPEKISYEIKNLREVIDEVKENREEDKKEYENNKLKLERRLGEMEIRNSVLEKSIQQWFKCHHLPQNGICPVADFVDKSEELIKKGVDEINVKKQL